MTQSRVRRLPFLITAALTAVCLLPSSAAAQLNGSNLKGDTGLKAGTQAPPGVYVGVPLWFYTADAVKGHEGNEILTGKLDATVGGVLLNVVTKKKVLGGNYGFVAVLPFANNRVQGAGDFDSNPGSGVTDMYVQPINLGWTRPRADFTAAYGLFLPTGRYEDGADDNTGLGMAGQELLFGTTVYLNKARSVHAATVATFDWFSEKKDSDTRVGNIINLEGGLGADFLKGGLTTGLAYFGTFKVTDDTFDARVPPRIAPDKNRVWGLGPEVTLALATKKAVYGFLTVRYQWEIAARTSTEGGVWNVLAVFPLKPIQLSKP
ncbi:MAG TPA: transporter [Vicinamibacterales bacterium]|nr:transporter [Vicinamibacterales bacterium]